MLAPKSTQTLKLWVHKIGALTHRGKLLSHTEPGLLATQNFGLWQRGRGGDTPVGGDVCQTGRKIGVEYPVSNIETEYGSDEEGCYCITTTNPNLTWRRKDVPRSEWRIGVPKRAARPGVKPTT
ncbi:hypothetical protein EVAR_89346_1 [Eumeta japonica]|uniref:Uncharacterized protein n=1 Tax=Eumeta variegata TaxID=151549 RepID=A0A4C1Y4U1_EUMVA|nr:hypothetical protein EVAR_89346_1 [Eumeta japonica]